MKSFASPLLRANVQSGVGGFACNGSEYLWILASGAGSRLIRSFQFGGACLLFAFSVAAQSESSPEYERKAVFMHNFARFTEWPQSAFATSNSPIVISVVGDDSFGRVLNETVRGETIKGRRLVVERSRRADEVKMCHILFISQSESRQLDEIVKSFKGRPILTVTDAPRPAFAGVVVRFSIEKHKLRFHINQEAAQTAGLKLSSRLLRMAETPPPVKKP